MTGVDIFEMKCELTIAVREVVEARHNFQIAQSIFSNYGIREGSSFLSCLRSHFESIIHSYFENKGKELTRQHADGTPAEVILDPRYLTFDHTRFANDEERYIGREAFEMLQKAEEAEAPEQIRLMCEALDSLHWEGIKSDFDGQVAGLASAGRKLVAETIVKELSMAHRFHDAKFKSGRFVFSASSATWMYHYNIVDGIHKLRFALCKVTEETGVNFGIALYELANAIEKLGYNDERIASRTMFGKGEAIEVCCFKEKYEYRFSQEAFDAIQAFITMYGGEAEIDAVMNAAALANNKAA